MALPMIPAPKAETTALQWLPTPGAVPFSTIPEVSREQPLPSLPTPASTPWPAAESLRIAPRSQAAGITPAERLPTPGGLELPEEKAAQQPWPASLPANLPNGRSEEDAAAGHRYGRPLAHGELPPSIPNGGSEDTLPGVGPAKGMDDVVGLLEKMLRATEQREQLGPAPSFTGQGIQLPPMAPLGAFGLTEGYAQASSSMNVSNLDGIRGAGGWGFGSKMGNRNAFLEQNRQDPRGQ